MGWGNVPSLPAAQFVQFHPQFSDPEPIAIRWTNAVDNSRVWAYWKAAGTGPGGE